MSATTSLYRHHNVEFRVEKIDHGFVSELTTASKRHEWANITKVTETLSGAVAFWTGVIDFVGLRKGAVN